jgi:hypothetical protein
MAELVSPQRLASSAAYPGGTPLQIVVGTGTRVVATAGAASTAEAAVPAGGNVLVIRAVAPVWIRFGATGMAAAAADANSILFVTGEAPYVLKTGEAFFRVLRVGSADVAVQLESAGTL